jgi:hypothetical protein
VHVGELASTCQPQGEHRRRTLRLRLAAQLCGRAGKRHADHRPGRDAVQRQRGQSASVGSAGPDRQRVRRTASPVQRSGHLWPSPGNSPAASACLTSPAS